MYRCGDKLQVGWRVYVVELQESTRQRTENRRVVEARMNFYTNKLACNTIAWSHALPRPLHKFRASVAGADADAI